MCVGFRPVFPHQVLEDTRYWKAKDKAKAKTKMSTDTTDLADTLRANLARLREARSRGEAVPAEALAGWWMPRAEKRSESERPKHTTQSVS